MRKLNGYRIGRIRQEGHYNDSLTLVYDNNTMVLSCGTNDDLYLYHDAENIYVMAMNHGLEYISLEVFSKADYKHTGDVFLQTHDDDTLSWMLEGSRYPTIIRNLLEYIY